jgi:hypothetical protein
MQSKAATVAEYLASLPEERRAVVEAVRRVILKNLDKTYAEGMGYGMIGYFVPHSFYPPGYHCDPRMPLPFAGLASQKRHLSLYLMTTYGEGHAMEQGFREAWAKTGKKLDMGKCCIRFNKLEDLALDVIADAIRRVPATDYIAHYEKLLREHNPRAWAKVEKLKAKSAGLAPAAAARKAATKPAKSAAGKRAAKKAARKKR